MTQKELLYMEDAIGHENSLISILEDTIDNLISRDLVNFLKDELKKHKAAKEKLMIILEELSNE